jgi:hypothetical protein
MFKVPLTALTRLPWRSVDVSKTGQKMKGPFHIPLPKIPTSKFTGPSAHLFRSIMAEKHAQISKPKQNFSLPEHVNRGGCSVASIGATRPESGQVGP